MNICLIGYNLTNFLLAILLSKKGFEVDIIFDGKNLWVVSFDEKVIDGFTFIKL